MKALIELADILVSRYYPRLRQRTDTKLRLTPRVVFEDARSFRVDFNLYQTTQTEPSSSCYWLRVVYSEYSNVYEVSSGWRDYRGSVTCRAFVGEEKDLLDRDVFAWLSKATKKTEPSVPASYVRPAARVLAAVPDEMRACLPVPSIREAIYESVLLRYEVALQGPSYMVYDAQGSLSTLGYELARRMQGIGIEEGPYNAVLTNVSVHPGKLLTLEVEVRNPRTESARTLLDEVQASLESSLALVAASYQGYAYLLFGYHSSIDFESAEVLTDYRKPALAEADNWIKHCVAGVNAKEGKANLKKAFAVCTASGQDLGYYKKGTRDLTAKGKARARSKARQPEHGDKVKAYEKSLKRNKT